MDITHSKVILRSCRKQNSKRGSTLVEIMIFMTLTLSLMGALSMGISAATRQDLSTEERLAAFYYCDSKLEELRNTDIHELVSEGLAAGDFADDGRTYKHGRKFAGLWVRDYALPLTGSYLPSSDDVNRPTGKVVVDDRIKIIAKPASRERTVTFMNKSTGIPVSGTETLVITLAMQDETHCYLCGVHMNWDSNTGADENKMSESISTIIYPDDFL